MTDRAERSDAAQAADAEHMANYVAALKAHDWQFEHSSDQRKWRAGRDSLAALREAQPLIDPDAIVWNEHAPASHQVHHAITDPTPKGDPQWP